MGLLQASEECKARYPLLRKRLFLDTGLEA